MLEQVFFLDFCLSCTFSIHASIVQTSKCLCGSSQSPLLICAAQAPYDIATAAKTAMGSKGQTDVTYSPSAGTFVPAAAPQPNDVQAAGRRLLQVLQAPSSTCIAAGGHRSNLI